MKYIRTQNNIYKADRVSVVNYNGTDCVEILERGCGAMVCRYETIIKEADTMGELCDEFVHYSITKPATSFIIDPVITIDILKNDIKCYNENAVAIYGAIWTSEGLKFVAKMNSDGVLERYEQQR